MFHKFCNETLARLSNNSSKVTITNAIHFPIEYTARKNKLVPILGTNFFWQFWLDFGCFELGFPFIVAFIWTL